MLANKTVEIVRATASIPQEKTLSSRQNILLKINAGNGLVSIMMLNVRIESKCKLCSYGIIA
jgi:hypothetical protein